MTNNPVQALIEKLLGAMYRSVDRMNQHWVTGNNAGVIAEKFYQENLRHNIEELRDENRD